MTTRTEPLRAFASRFALALHRFSRLRPGGPLAPPAQPDAETAAAALGHLPGVGVPIGLAACLLFALVALALRGNPWSAAVAAVACTALAVLLTGARHETGVARLVAALDPAAAPWHGVIALVLLVAGKIALLAALAAASEAAVLAALLAAHVMSRFLPVLLAHRMTVGATPDPRMLRTAALWCVVPAALLLAAGGPGLLLLPLLATAAAGWALLRLAASGRAGWSEDMLGAVQQAAEVAFLFGAAVAAR